MSGERADDRSATTVPPAPTVPPAAAPHWYLENGLVVFTAAHHLARGSCCGSGCRHCPFDPPHAAGGTKAR